MQVLRIATFILLAAVLFGQQPAPLTDRERAEVLELIAEKYAADAAEADAREQLQQQAQKVMQEARQKRIAAQQAVEAKVNALLEGRKAKAEDWQLNPKTGAWVKREAKAQPAKP